MDTLYLITSRILAAALLLSTFNTSGAPLVLARPAAAPTTSFFDHFGENLLNTALWTFGTNGSASGYAVSGSQLAIQGGVTNGGGAWVLSTPVYSLTTRLQVFEARLRTSSASNDYFDWGLWGDNHDGAMLFSGGPGEPFFVYTRPDNVSAIISTTLPGVDPTFWHTYRIEFGQTEIRYYVDGQLKTTHTTGLPLNRPMHVRLDRGSTGVNQTLWVDWASMATGSTIAVSTTTDELNGDGDCSLREAVRAANLDSAVDACPAGSGADIIIVPSGIYTLTLAGANEDAALTGDLDITDTLTISGAGSASTIIDGNASDRIFDIHAANVMISGFTIRNGLANGAAEEGHGGGIRNTQVNAQGVITLTNIALVSNIANDQGGGLLTHTGQASLTNGLVMSNTSNNGGGGVANWSAMTIAGSDFHGNNGGLGGGGIYAVGNTTILDSAVWGNATTGTGSGNGGAGVGIPYAGQTVVITNTTLSGNSAANQGGGIIYASYSITPVLSLYNVTLTGNSAATGGGIYRYDGSATLVNTLIANNISGNCAGSAVLTSSGYNLSSDATCPLSGPGDLNNTNPQLSPLQDNGGPTLTHALLPGSPAMDAGDNAICPATDQRGVARPQNGICDIGAYEAAPVFEAVTTPFENLSNGDAEWGDYDSDGDLDVLLTGCNPSCVSGQTKLYRNEGGGAFTDIAASLPNPTSSTAAWGDYDNDGRLDLALAGDTGAGYYSGIYHNNGNGTFTDIGAGLVGVASGALAWGDYDNDGRLDLALSGCTMGWCPAATSRIYHNDGAGVFTDIGAGLAGVFASSMAWGDYDNDGDLDLLMNGSYPSSVGFAGLYRNEGSGAFTLSAGLPTGGYGEVAWGDYDSDGWLDILFTGGAGLPFTAGVSRNNGNGTFGDIGAGLQGVTHATAGWGDYDNDGALDFFLSGTVDATCNPYSRVYRNAGSNTFVNINAGLISLCYSSFAWGDYDNDGDLDLLMLGSDGYTEIVRLYRNTVGRANQPPSAPTGLTANVGGSSVTLSWNAAGDSQTPANGLTYNVRVGTTPGGAQTLSPMASGAGYRYVPQLGNVQHGLTATLSGLAPGVYYWSVQAVDPAFAGSAFAAEGTFSIGVVTFSASGRVAEAGGAGIPGVAVSAGPGLTALTNANGDYTLFNLITGTYTLTPTLPGYTFSPVTRTASVPPNATAKDFIGTPPAPTPPTSVSIFGPDSGAPNSAYAFNATVTPVTATLPITYTWNPTPNTGQGTSTVNYLWETDGAKTITVTASNPGGSAQATHIITLTASLTLGDNFEPDNTCAQSQAIAADGTLQPRTFHTAGDEDWVSVPVISGTTYIIEALTPSDSVADVGMQLHTSCDVLPFAGQGYAFSPDVRYRFTAPANGTYRLRLTDANSTGGPRAAYDLSVRALSNAPTPGAVVIVAGYLRANDPLQSNIYHVTNEMYKLFRGHGYDASRLYYFAKNMNLDADSDGTPDVDAPPTKAYLSIAFNQVITQVAANRALTVFLMDHGGYDKFYLDGPANETLAPDELDAWLDAVEAAVPGVKINVLIEACYSGSFIDLVKTVSKPGRVIITSTGANAVAYSSSSGAAFSDALLASLGQDLSLYNGFLMGRDAAHTAHPDQTPWLDDNGDGVPNGPTDGQAAAQRGFAYAGTFADTLAWPPYLASAQVGSVVANQGVITAEVRDDPVSHVVSAYAVVYKPSYRPPATSEELAQETLPTVTLLDPNHDGIYTGLYEGFTEIGTYRFVIYALDSDGLSAEPRAVGYGSVLYLPVIRR